MALIKLDPLCRKFGHPWVKMKINLIWVLVYSNMRGFSPASSQKNMLHVLIDVSTLPHGVSEWSGRRKATYLRCPPSLSNNSWVSSSKPHDPERKSACSEDSGSNPSRDLPGICIFSLSMHGFSLGMLTSSQSHASQVKWWLQIAPWCVCGPATDSQPVQNVPFHDPTVLRVTPKGIKQVKKMHW